MRDIGPVLKMIAKKNIPAAWLNRMYLMIVGKKGKFKIVLSLDLKRKGYGVNELAIDVDSKSLE